MSLVSPGIGAANGSVLNSRKYHCWKSSCNRWSYLSVWICATFFNVRHVFLSKSLHPHHHFLWNFCWQGCKFVFGSCIYGWRNRPCNSVSTKSDRPPQQSCWTERHTFRCWSTNPNISIKPEHHVSIPKRRHFDVKSKKNPIAKCRSSHLTLFCCHWPLFCLDIVEKEGWNVLATATLHMSNKSLY
jgi:hypothetical protein